MRRLGRFQGGGRRGPRRVGGLLGGTITGGGRLELRLGDIAGRAALDSFRRQVVVVHQCGLQHQDLRPSRRTVFQNESVRGLGLQELLHTLFDQTQILLAAASILVTDGDLQRFVQLATAQLHQVHGHHIPRGIQIVFHNIRRHDFLGRDGVVNLVNGVRLVAESEIGIGQVPGRQLQSQLSRTGIRLGRCGGLLGILIRVHQGLVRLRLLGRRRAGGLGELIGLFFGSFGLFLGLPPPLG